MCIYFRSIVYEDGSKSISIDEKYELTPEQIGIIISWAQVMLLFLVNDYIMNNFRISYKYAAEFTKNSHKLKIKCCFLSFNLPLWTDRFQIKKNNEIRIYDKLVS